MKNLLKLEETGLLILFSFIYFHMFPGAWGFYAAVFFVPDISFAAYLLGKKPGAIVYNLLHHRGLIAIVIIAGFLLHADILTQVGLVFLCHSTFDRVAGYGLKYFDGFEHTHLGWIGKRKGKENAV